MRNQGIKVCIEGGVLSISIGIDLLCFAVGVGIDQKFGGTVKVTDNDVFAAEILNQLQREEEDGTTPVHMMLDAAACEAVEQGAEGIEDNG